LGSYVLLGCLYVLCVLPGRDLLAGACEGDLPWFYSPAFFLWESQLRPVLGCEEGIRQNLLPRREGVLEHRGQATFGSSLVQPGCETFHRVGATRELLAKFLLNACLILVD